MLKYANMYSPFFFMEYQRAIKIHHQKEVAVKIVETVPALRVIHESHRACHQNLSMNRLNGQDMIQRRSNV